MAPVIDVANAADTEDYERWEQSMNWSKDAPGLAEAIAEELDRL